MNVWIYRPDIEAAACRLNRHFVYDGRGKAYFEACEQRARRQRIRAELCERERRRKLRPRLIEAAYV